MDREELQAWIAERGAKDELLYEQHGRPLEPEHKGEFVVIGDDGRIILGTDQMALTKKAIEEFGSGNFCLRRIGADAEIHLRNWWP